MKYIQTLITMVVGGAVLALGSSVVAQTVKPCVVTVVRIQGQARYSLGDNAGTRWLSARCSEPEPSFKVPSIHRWTSC